jgi:type II secretory pathway component PulK
LIIVIVALTVASMIGAALLQMAFMQHRQMQHDRLRAQAGWIAETGLQRALQRIAADAKYQGETWTVDVPGRDRTQQAEVQITIGEDANQTVTAVATYPQGETFRARVRRSAPSNSSAPKTP